jgi:hypothetical protein
MKFILATLVFALSATSAQEEDVSYPIAIAVATFTGPVFLGQFNFYQDDNGQVTATGALHQGLEESRDYRFRFYSGPNCEELGDVVLEHQFKSMQVLSLGGTAPIQELIEDAHLSGEGGVLESPWVLADENQELACVMLKKVTE